MDRRESRPGEQKRAALDRPVALRFKHFEEFTEELATNVSSGGMFIRTRRPHPVGSVFEFELRPGGGRPSITGKAQVAWVRRRDETAEKPAGMGTRFVELDNECRRHVVELASARGTSGDPTHDTEPPPAVAAAAGETSVAKRAPATAGRPTAGPPAPTAAAGGATATTAPTAAAAGRQTTTPPGGRAESAVKRRLGGRLPAGLLALVLAAALAAAFWWPPSGAGPPADATATAPAPIATRQAEAAPGANGPGANESAANGRDAAPATRPAQLRLVDEWARAWSEQRVDDYLDAYSARFTPDGGLDRAGWERRRRGRVLAPQRIEVALALVELEELGADSSRVRFVQAYESDSYRDVVRKVLELEREADGWKIVRESVEK